MKKLTLWLKISLVLQLFIYFLSIFLQYIDLAEIVDSGTGLLSALLTPLWILNSIINAIFIGVYVYKSKKQNLSMDHTLIFISIAAFLPYLLTSEVGKWLDRVELNN